MPTMQAPAAITTGCQVIFPDGTAVNVDVNGNAVIPDAFVNYAEAQGFRIVNKSSGCQYKTETVGTTSALAAGQMEGQRMCFLALSGGATPTFTTRTAAQLIAALPNWAVGESYFLRVYNTNSGTVTLAGGSGVTITGTATIATAKSRDYTVTLTTATTVTMQNVGSGVAD